MYSLNGISYNNKNDHSTAVHMPSGRAVAPQRSAFLNKIVSEYSHTHLLMYCLWLLSHYCKVE